MEAAIVLAGGRSRRLGRDKAFQVLEGKTLLERAVVAVSQTARQVMVVKAPGQELPPLPIRVDVVDDLVPGRGPLGGLYTGLESTTAEVVCVVGCDMTFLDPPLLDTLVPLAQGQDAVVPRLDGGLQTLHALYRRTSLPTIRELLEAQGPGLHDLLALLNVYYVEVEDVDRWRRSCLNVNTPADLEEAAGYLASLPNREDP